MTTRRFRLALAGGGALLAAFTIWGFSGRPASTSSPDQPGSVSSGPVQPELVSPGSVGGTPVASPVPEATSAAPRRSYAIGLHELQGLSPDVPAGTHLELWVAWDPPVTDAPRVEPLLDDVVLERLIPPSVPEGPTTVLLSIPRKATRLMIYGDRYGALSAITRN